MALAHLWGVSMASLTQIVVLNPQDAPCGIRIPHLLDMTLTPFVGSLTLIDSLAARALMQLHMRWPLAGCTIMGDGTALPRVISVGRH